MMRFAPSPAGEFRLHATEQKGPASQAPAAEPGPLSEAPSPFRETRYGWLVLAVVWLACAAYLGARLRDGWIPFDSGMLAQEALRTLHGQVPHLDFGELYTGGLTYLNALAFRVFGINFFSLRIPLFLFFLGWVPAVYFIARRFAGPFAAGAVTLLAVAWSVPNYPEAMPSWYNLFFATWGVLALLRYTETERRRWLLVAGLCAGLSFLAKISGLYFVAAALLYFVFRGQGQPASGSEGEAGPGNIGYRLFVTAGLALFFASLIILVSQRPTLGDLFQFALPSACLVAFLLWGNWLGARGSNRENFGRLFKEELWFLVGALAPVAIFLSWFASRRAVGAWFTGVFIQPALRTHWSAYNAISVTALVGLLPAGLIVVAALDTSRFTRRIARWAGPAGLGVLLLAAWKWLGIYALVAYSTPLLVPLIALAAPLCLCRSSQLPERKREQAFLLISAAVLCALIQFPFSSALYFEYVAPLVLLALIALLPRHRSGERVALGSLLAFYLLFAIWLHTPGYYLGLGLPPRQAFHFEKFGLARAGDIRAPAPLPREYRAVVALVRAHARGHYVYATPDMPAIYFLSGLENPTPTISDLFDSDFFNPVGRDLRILQSLGSHHVNVVVLGPGNRTLAGKIQPGLRVLLDARYPESMTVGHFEVRWRP